MSTQGVTASTSASASTKKPLSQLQLFCERIFTAENYPKNIPGLGYPEYLNILDDIGENVHLLQDIIPGTLVKLDTTNLYFDVYGARRLNSDYYLVILKLYPKEWYDVESDGEWHPISAFSTRLTHFISVLQERIPLHVSPLDCQLLLTAISEALKNQIYAHLETGTYYKFEIVDDFGEVTHCRILKSDVATYKLLYLNKHDGKYHRIDSLIDEIYVDDNGNMLSLQAIELLKRVGKADKYYQEHELPQRVTNLFTTQMLHEALEYVAQNSQVRKSLVADKGFKIAKQPRELCRTLNVVEGEKGELMLMFETKRKDKSGSFSAEGSIYRKERTKIKRAWRVDAIPIEPWVNKVKEGQNAVSSQQGAYFSQQFSSPFINVSFLGPFHKGRNSQQSQYSRCGVNNLKAVLSKENSLSIEQKHRITRFLLQEISRLHRLGLVHQDITTANVLLDKDEFGYIPKLTDFDNAFVNGSANKMESLGYYLYASPELYLAYESRTSEQHRYYYFGNFDQNPLGYIKNQSHANREIESELAKSYRLAHPANDMWALGILLYQLYFGLPKNWDDPCVQNNIARDPLISRLLTVDREKRCTAQQALAIFETMTSIAAPAVAMTSRPKS